MIKIKPNYPCNSCELRRDERCPLNQGFKCNELKKYEKEMTQKDV